MIPWVALIPEGLISVGTYALGLFVGRNAWKHADLRLAEARLAQFETALATTESGRVHLAQLKERQR